MKIRVRRFGGVLSLEIPEHIAAETGLREDSEIDLTVEQGAVVARPSSSRKYTLEELLTLFDAGQRHPETDTGGPIGREEW